MHKETLDVIVREELVKSFIQRVPVRLASKIDHRCVDAINDNSVVISHIGFACLYGSVLPTIEGMIHPALTWGWLESSTV